MNKKKNNDQPQTSMENKRNNPTNCKHEHDDKNKQERSVR